MRSNISASIFLAFSALWASTSSLPLVEQRAQKASPLAPRYSVVPINGGSGTSGSKGSGTGTGTGSNGASDDSPVTVVKTVVSTLPQKTTIETVKVFPTVTQHVTNTVTSISTVNINPNQETKTQISVVYVTPSSSSSRAPTTNQSGTLNTSTSRSTVLSASSQSTTPLETYSAQPSVIESTLPPFTTPIPLSTAYSSTRTYDNGMWHTTYPSWNGTFARHVARA